VVRRFLAEHRVDHHAGERDAALGGFAGVTLGLVAAFGFAYVADWSVIVDYWAVVSAVLFSMLIGALFGWYPAQRASRLAPIEAIRTT
jgi:putative ABC transport system permease protein